MTPEEFSAFLEAMGKGRPICMALLKIDDPTTLKQILCASIDTWCTKYGYDPCEIVGDMLGAIVEVNLGVDVDTDEDDEDCE